MIFKRNHELNSCICAKWMLFPYLSAGLIDETDVVHVANGGWDSQEKKMLYNWKSWIGMNLEVNPIESGIQTHTSCKIVHDNKHDEMFVYFRVLAPANYAIRVVSGEMSWDQIESHFKNSKSITPVKAIMRRDGEMYMIKDYPQVHLSKKVSKHTC